MKTTDERDLMQKNKSYGIVCQGFFYVKNRNKNEICKNRDKCYKYKTRNTLDNNSREVEFLHVDSFRNCRLYEDKTEEGHDVLATSIYNILYVNDLACASVVELKDYIPEQDKETRKIYGALIKRQEKYEETLREILGKEIYVFSEYNNYMDEHVIPLLDMFRLNMENIFKDMGERNYKFMALVEVARTILGYSVCSVENRVKECLKYQSKAVNLRRYKLEEMKRIIESLSDWVTRRCANFNLNNDTRLIESYRALDKMLTNPQVIGDSIRKSKQYGDSI